MENSNLVVDCDSHVMEPPDLWERYIEPKYRDRAIRIVRDPDNGLEIYWLITSRWCVGYWEDSVALTWSGKASSSREVAYMEGCPPASYLPAERIKMLDAWGVDAGVLFPTVGILWDVADNGLASAYACAYNNWVNDFAAYNRRR